MRRVFFSTGEASGDAYAAALARRLPSVPIEAVGGNRLRELGATIVADSRAWGAIGAAEALRVAPRVLRGYLAARRRLAADAPGVFVPIDFGFVNVRLARHARTWGWRVLYFVPPGSWRRDRQGNDLPDVAHTIVTPFPWSAEILRGMGADARFYGHPLKSMIAEDESGPADRRGVAVLPGSRIHEIEHNLPVIRQALDERYDPVEFAVAPNVSRDEIARRWERPATYTVRDPYRVLRRARAAVVCSGTATLEAALCRCPFVVVYRGSRLMEIEYRLRRPRFEFIALPNLLLRRAVVPELIQWDASPARIRAELDALLADPSRQLEAFAELDATLGPADCLARTADLIRTLAAS